jgi:hypothetical protein
MERFMSDKSNSQYIQGFGSSTVAPHKTANILVTVQASFHPDRLIIASDVASDVLVTALSIDRLNQLASVGAIPGETFLAATGLKIPMARAKQGDTVVLSVLNKRDRDIHVSASLSGELL